MKTTEQLYDEAIVLIEDENIYPAIYNRVRELEQQKAELIAEIERIEKAEQIDINLDLDDYN